MYEDSGALITYRGQQLPSPDRSYSGGCEINGCCSNDLPMRLHCMLHLLHFVIGQETKGAAAFGG